MNCHLLHSIVDLTDKYCDVRFEEMAFVHVLDNGTDLRRLLQEFYGVNHNQLANIIKRVLTYESNRLHDRPVPPFIEDPKHSPIPRLGDATDQYRFEQDIKLITALAKAKVRHREYGVDHVCTRIAQRYTFISGIVFEELDDERGSDACRRIAEIINGHFDALPDLVAFDTAEAAG
jgi:hypothetical protein